MRDSRYHPSPLIVAYLTLTGTMLTSQLSVRGNHYRSVLVRKRVTQPSVATKLYRSSTASYISYLSTCLGNKRASRDNGDAWPIRESERERPCSEMWVPISKTLAVVFVVTAAAAAVVRRLCQQEGHAGCSSSSPSSSSSLDGL